MGAAREGDAAVSTATWEATMKPTFRGVRKNAPGASLMLSGGYGLHAASVKVM
jgi:hypothetical protein